MKNKLVSINEAARLMNVTRQAVYMAVRGNKLKANKDPDLWNINTADLRAYNKSKYDRSKSVFDGELKYDNEKGFYSINQIARKLRVPPQKIYYNVRLGRIRYHRKGCAIVINIDDAMEYAEKFLGRFPAKTA